MMPTELLYLFLTSILLALLWIPHIAGQVMFGGTLKPEEYVSLREPMDNNFVKRANRAHVNLVEQFGAFAGLVVVAQFAEVSTSLTADAAVAFFWIRVLHAIVMLTGFRFFMARTVVFTASWMVLLVIAWEIADARLF